MMFIGDAFALAQLGPDGFKEYRAKQKAEYQRKLDALKAFDFGVWYPADTHPGAHALCFVGKPGSVRLSYGWDGVHWLNEYGNGPLYDYGSKMHKSGLYTVPDLTPAQPTHWMRYPEPPPPATGEAG